MSEYYDPGDPNRLANNTSKAAQGMQEWLKDGREKPVYSRSGVTLALSLARLNLGACLNLPPEAIVHAEAFVHSLKNAQRIVRQFAASPWVLGHLAGLVEICDEEDITTCIRKTVDLAKAQTQIHILLSELYSLSPGEMQREYLHNAQGSFAALKKSIRSQRK